MDAGDLRGLRILVVEDEYYIAADTMGELIEAGANAIGPFGSESEALLSIAQEPPDFAVVDINLGRGPSFAIARALREQRIPFIFVTGYDEWTIPCEFEGTPLLQKPVDRGAMAAALSELGITKQMKL